MAQQSLLRFLAQHCALGVGTGWLVAGGLLAFDTGGLRTLIFGSAEPSIALGLLLFGMAVTFGSVAMGVAIMGLASKDDGGRR